MPVARVVDIERFKKPHPGFYTLHDCCCDYSRDRLIAKGKDCLRAWSGFNLFMEFVDPHMKPADISIGHVEDYVDMRVAKGVSVLTVRRELTFLKSAVHNAYRRHRIEKNPYIELPDGPMKERRPLTEEEFRLVIRQPMSKRLRRFYWTAYFTGHRSTAIEELEWERVYLDRRYIDFNVPGRVVTNKKRAKDFPIVDEFMVRLQSWREDSPDRFVIGAGANTYHEASYVVRKLAGITDPSLVPRHCMRKMFATELFARGADPEVVGKIMADDPNTLRRDYVDFPDPIKRGVANLRWKPLERTRA